jgi:hypothetical protein
MTMDRMQRVARVDEFEETSYQAFLIFMSGNILDL